MAHYVEVAQMAGYRLLADAETLRIKQAFVKDGSVEEYQLTATQYMQLLDQVEEYIQQARHVGNQAEEYRLLAKQRGIEHELRQWDTPVKNHRVK